jgi:hypothetical protein
MSLLTAKQACKFIGVTRTALHQARKKGAIDPVKRQPNGYFLYEQNEVERFVSERNRRRIAKEKQRARKKKLPSLAELLSGRRSGIENYHGAATSWQRWLNRVGGTHGMRKWPTGKLENWLLDVEVIAETIDFVRSELEARGICTNLYQRKRPDRPKNTTE